MKMIFTVSAFGLISIASAVSGRWFRPTAKAAERVAGALAPTRDGSPLNGATVPP